MWARFRTLNKDQKTPVAFLSEVGYQPASLVGVSPSGKAAVFGIAIPRFESWYPSQGLFSSLKSPIWICASRMYAEPNLLDLYVNGTIRGRYAGKSQVS